MNPSNSTHCCQRGLTLIEVVAGLALMGTLIASALTAKAQYARQQSHAQRVLEAVAVADSFLIGHAQNLDELERIGSGMIDQHDHLAWSVKRQDEPSAARWYCKVLRFQVNQVSADTNDPPLVSVDLLLPDIPAIPQQNESEPHTSRQPSTGQHYQDSNRKQDLDRDNFQTGRLGKEGGN